MPWRSPPLCSTTGTARLALVGIFVPKLEHTLRGYGYQRNGMDLDAHRGFVALTGRLAQERTPVLDGVRGGRALGDIGDRISGPNGKSASVCRTRSASQNAKAIANAIKKEKRSDERN